MLSRCDALKYSRTYCFRDSKLSSRVNDNQQWTKNYLVLRVFFLFYWLFTSIYNDIARAEEIKGVCARKSIFTCNRMMTSSIRNSYTFSPLLLPLLLLLLMYICIRLKNFHIWTHIENKKCLNDDLLFIYTSVRLFHV